MDETVEQINKDLEARLKEAKVYYSMGLLEEARGVYERMMADYRDDLPPHSSQRIQEWIQRIQAEIAEEEEAENAGLSPGQEALLLRAEGEGKDSQTIMDEAAALLERGEAGQALGEYEKLFGLGVPFERFLSGVVMCLLRLHRAERLEEASESLAAEHGLGKQDKAKLKFKLGLELEEQGLKEPALELYRAARRTVPEDLNMRSALDTKIAGLSKDGPHSYLINQGWITSSELEQAKDEAAGTDKSVEQALMESFNLKKEDVARSLAVYFELPVKTYDPNLMTPLDVFSKLDPAVLRTEGWVPLASHGREAEILMLDPRDRAKLARIKSMLGTETLQVSAGIREDIEAFITRFSKDARDSAPGRTGASGRPAQPPAGRENRRERRYVPAIPDFVYVEFELQPPGGEPKSYRLDVLNCSEHGIGLLVRKQDFSLLEAVGPGTTLENAVFYATWTLIRAEATVRHLTRIKEGRHKGCYVMGVESKEIIESSKVPD